MRYSYDVNYLEADSLFHTRQILVPIHNLPIELISQIFLDIFEGLRKTHTYTLLLRNLLVISSVCSSWRQVTLSTPHLWTYIVVPEWTWRTSEWSRGGNGTEASFKLSLLQAHIKRSRNLSFDLICDFERFQEVMEAQVWSIIIPHLDRCRHLDVRLARRAIPELVLPWTQKIQLKRLEYIGITSPGVVVQTHPPAFFEHTELIPELTEMSLRDIYFAPFRVNSLTRLTLSYRMAVAWTSVAVFLVESTSLEWLALHLQFKLPGSDPSAQPILLPKLVHLTMPDLPFDRYICTPQLQTLSCFNYRGRITIAPSTQLKHLRLNTSYPNVLRDWRPPSWLADIETLDLAGDGTAEDILGILFPSTEGENNPEVFPSLSMLRLFQSPVAPEAHDQFCDHLLRLLDSRPKLYIECDSSIPDIPKTKQEAIGGDSETRLSIAAEASWGSW